jgi:hypothetical protein
MMVWWTMISIAAVAGWFEWQYRRGKAQKKSPKDEEEKDPGPPAKPVESATRHGDPDQPQQRADSA